MGNETKYKVFPYGWRSYLWFHACIGIVLWVNKQLNWGFLGCTVLALSFNPLFDRLEHWILKPREITRPDAEHHGN